MLGLSWTMQPPWNSEQLSTGGEQDAFGGGHDPYYHNHFAGAQQPQNNFFGWDELETLVEEEISRFNRFYLGGTHGGAGSQADGGSGRTTADGLLAKIFNESEVSYIVRMLYAGRGRGDVLS